MGIQEYVHALDAYLAQWRTAIDGLGQSVRLPVDVSTFAPSGWARLYLWPASVSGTVRLYRAMMVDGHSPCDAMRSLRRALRSHQLDVPPLLKVLRRERDRVPPPSGLTGLEAVVARDDGAQRHFREACCSLNGMAQALQGLVVRLEFIDAKLEEAINALDSGLCGLLTPDEIEAGILHELLSALE